MRTSQLKPRDSIGAEIERNPRIECQHFPNDTLSAMEACPINPRDLIGRELTPDDWKNILGPMGEWHERQLTAKVCHIFISTLYCFCDEHNGNTENENIPEEQMAAFVRNVSKFIFDEVQRKSPQINGVGFGFPFGMSKDELRKLWELPKDQQMGRVKELLVVIITTETDLTEEQKLEIYRLIGEKFFSIGTVSESTLCYHAKNLNN